MSADQMDHVDRICAIVSEASGDVGELVDDAVRRIAPLALPDEQRRITSDALARLTGLGELDALVADESIDEVLVTGDAIWIDRNGTIEAAGHLTTTTAEVVIERILGPIGRRLDRTSPIVDARLANGARVCAVVAPVAVDGPALSIRRFAARVRSLDHFGDRATAELCEQIITGRCNVVVSGATSSGKTSLLASLTAAVDDGERLVVVEDTAELPCDAPHRVRLESRPATVEGLHAITLADLVRTALRLRPDRLVVGEVRGDEVLALVQAMNTGHDGSFSTCHANGPLDALYRIESLVVQAAPRWPLTAIRTQLARSIDVVVHVGRSGATRRVESIVEVVAPEPGRGEVVPAVRPLLTIDDDGTTRLHGELARARR